MKIVYVRSLFTGSENYKAGCQQIKVLVTTLVKRQLKPKVILFQKQSGKYFQPFSVLDKQRYVHVRKQKSCNALTKCHIKCYANYENTEGEIKGKTKSLASNDARELTVL